MSFFFLKTEKSAILFFLTRLARILLNTLLLCTFGFCHLFLVVKQQIVRGVSNMVDASERSFNISKNFFIGRSELTAHS